MVVDGSEVKTTSVEKMYKFFIFLIVCYDSMNVCIYIKEKKKNVYYILYDISLRMYILSQSVMKYTHQMYAKSPTYKLCNSILKHLLRSTADSLYKMDEIKLCHRCFLKKN